MLHATSLHLLRLLQHSQPFRCRQARQALTITHEHTHEHTLAPDELCVLGMQMCSSLEQACCDVRCVVDRHCTQLTERCTTISISHMNSGDRRANASRYERRPMRTLIHGYMICSGSSSFTMSRGSANGIFQLLTFATVLLHGLESNARSQVVNTVECACM